MLPRHLGPDGAGVIDFSLQQLVLRFIAIVFIAALHGFAVAAAACALGDPGPRHDGRLSLNPLAHMDVVGTASGVLFSVGWIRPIAVDPGELGVGRIGLLIVVAAGVTYSGARFDTLLLLSFTRTSGTPAVVTSFSGM